jgi:tetratricopeptide (TPR) repeat protein
MQWICVLCGCMFLLSLRATSQVWTVSLKAGLYTYKAVERARRVDRRRETQWLAYLSDVYLRAGRLDDAPTMAERLLALGRERRERSTEARGWHLFGEIAIQCESPHAEEAEAPYRQALALAEERGLHPLQAHCHLGLGTRLASGSRRMPHCPPLSASTGPWT